MRTITLTPNHDLNSEPYVWWTEAAYLGAQKARQRMKQPPSVRAGGGR
jgi:hypothetical protein